MNFSRLASLARQHGGRARALLPASKSAAQSPADKGEPTNEEENENMNGENGEYGEEGEEGADVLGALFRRRRGGQNQGRQVYNRPPLPRNPVQDVTARLRSYMGFGFVVWTAADATDKVIIVEPQESFRGERLIADVTAAGGTSAGLTLLRRIDIGTQPQSPSVEQPAPLAMFARDATGAELDLQVAFRATKVQITLGISAAPGAGVTVTAALGMFGQWIR